MGKKFSLTFNVKDDDSVEIDSLKVKLESPKKPTPKTPPGQDFVIRLLLLLLGIWSIVTFFIPGGQKSINQIQPEPEPTPSPQSNNSTANLPQNYQPLEIYFKDY
ncbi:MAG: hypothetical protein AB4080_18680 [Trichodesmium sp.]